MLSQKSFRISQSPRSVLSPYRSAVYIIHTANSRTRLLFCGLYIAILRRLISRPLSPCFAIDNDTISVDNSHAYVH